MGVGKTLVANTQALASDINTIAQWGLSGDIPATEDVLKGSLYFETDTNILKQEQNGAWVAILSIKTLNPANETVDAGYYAATTLSTVDADLAAANIKGGVTIFGFAGTYAPPVTEGFYVDRTATGDLGAAYSDLQSAAVPAAAKKVILTVAASGGGSSQAFYCRGTYNAVERIAEFLAANLDVFAFRRWSGDSVGTAADAKIQGKQFDATYKSGFYACACYYVS